MEDGKGKFVWYSHFIVQNTLEREVVDHDAQRTVGLFSMNCKYGSPENCNNSWRIWCDGSSGCGEEGYVDIEIQIQCCK